MSKTKKDKIFSWLFRDICAITFIGFYYLILSLLDITCPVKAILKIDCPCCGSTTAIIKLISFDIDAYIKSNAMALPLCVAFYIAIHYEQFCDKKIIDIMLVIISILTIINYFLNILF